MKRLIIDWINAAPEALFHAILAGGGAYLLGAVGGWNLLFMGVPNAASAVGFGVFVFFVSLENIRKPFDRRW